MILTSPYKKRILRGYTYNMLDCNNYLFETLFLKKKKYPYPWPGYQKIFYSQAYLSNFGAIFLLLFVSDIFSRVLNYLKKIYNIFK